MPQIKKKEDYLRTMTERVKNKLDPCEEWLANMLLGSHSKILSIKQIKRTIKFSIAKEIDKMLNQSNQTGPYVNLKYIYPYRKIIKVTYKKLKAQTQGLLIPQKGGFEIQINQYLDFINKRVTLAHEIAHTFFYDIHSDIPIIPFAINQSNFWTREGYTYEITRAILIPEKSITSIIKERKTSPSIESLRKLSKLYKTTNNVLQKRIIHDLNLWDCIIFIAEFTGENIIQVNPTLTSKGNSFKGINIPRAMNNSNDKIAGELYSFLLSVFENKYKKGEININNKQFYIESIALSQYDRIYLTSILSSIPFERGCDLF